MSSFQYIDRSGKLATVDANNATDALRMIAGNAAPKSGVISNPPGVGNPAPGPTGGATDTGGGSTADPTISGSPVRRYTTTSSGVGANSSTGKIDQYFSTLDTGPVNESAIRSEMRQQAQGQLDAINRSYDAIVSQDRATGVVNAGKTRATQARSGNLGSDFGNSAITTDAEHTDSVVAADEAARANAIANILANVDSRSDTKIQAEKTLRQTNADAYIKHLTDVANSSRSDVINLAKSGVDYDALTQDQYTKLLDQTGYTPEQLKAQFVLNAPDPIYKGTVGSKYITITRDPTTGKIKSQSFDLGFTVPQDYNSTTLDTGQVIFTPKNWDGDPKKIITYGQPSAKYNSEVAKNYADAAKANADAKNSPAAGYSIPTTNRNNLEKVMTPKQVDALQEDIRNYGLGKALDGLDPTTKDFIQSELDKNYTFGG